MARISQVVFHYLARNSIDKREVSIKNINVLEDWRRKHQQYITNGISQEILTRSTCNKSK